VLVSCRSAHDDDSFLLFLASLSLTHSRNFLNLPTTTPFPLLPTAYLPPPTSCSSILPSLCLPTPLAPPFPSFYYPFLLSSPPPHPPSPTFYSNSPFNPLFLRSASPPHPLFNPPPPLLSFPLPRLPYPSSLHVPHFVPSHFTLHSSSWPSRPLSCPDWGRGYELSRPWPSANCVWANR